ncbi:MAG TPA: hypothetical protein VMV47_14770 [Bacteroidales bacterium]|nr:hypothetical protein [Bacteroidales bacterium]
MKTKTGKEIENTMNKNPNNWKGLFYFNRRDYRLIVPKSNPYLGWTFNFASPYTYLFIVALVALALTFKYLL